jgi:hypothetical protein
MSRYDWLLFLHVLSAFAIVGSLVLFTTVLVALRHGGEAAGATLRLTPLARRLMDVGGTGTLVLGVWLAIDPDGYDLLDGWVLGALVLWALAAYAATRLGLAFQGAGDGGEVTVDSRATLLYAVMAVAVAALLVVMIFKPGA